MGWKVLESDLRDRTLWWQGNESSSGANQLRHLDEVGGSWDEGKAKE